MESLYEQDFDSDSTASADESEIKDFEVSTLKPFQFEPMYAVGEKIVRGEKSNQSERVRVGNTEWCLCGNCRPMQSEIESLCCQENESGINDDHFQGN